MPGNLDSFRRSACHGTQIPICSWDERVHASSAASPSHRCYVLLMSDASEPQLFILLQTACVRFSNAGNLIRQKPDFHSTLLDEHQAARGTHSVSQAPFIKDAFSNGGSHIASCSPHSIATSSATCHAAFSSTCPRHHSVVLQSACMGFGSPGIPARQQPTSPSPLAWLPPGIPTLFWKLPTPSVTRCELSTMRSTARTRPTGAHFGFYHVSKCRQVTSTPLTSCKCCMCKSPVLNLVLRIAGATRRVDRHSLLDKTSTCMLH